MAKTYKYVVELSEPMYPRHLADCMQMQGNLARTLLSVTDLQRDDHVYGATYVAQEPQDVRDRRIMKAAQALRVGAAVRVAMNEEDKQIGKLADINEQHQDGDFYGVTFDNGATITYYWAQELEVIE